MYTSEKGDLSTVNTVFNFILKSFFVRVFLHLFILQVTAR